MLLDPIDRGFLIGCLKHGDQDVQMAAKAVVLAEVKRLAETMAVVTPTSSQPDDPAPHAQAD